MPPALLFLAPTTTRKMPSLAWQQIKFCGVDQCTNSQWRHRLNHDQNMNLECWLLLHCCNSAIWAFCWLVDIWNNLKHLKWFYHDLGMMFTPPDNLIRQEPYLLETWVHSDTINVSLGLAVSVRFTSLPILQCCLWWILHPREILTWQCIFWKYSSIWGHMRKRAYMGNTVPYRCPHISMISWYMGVYENKKAQISKSDSLEVRAYKGSLYVKLHPWIVPDVSVKWVSNPPWANIGRV